MYFFLFFILLEMKIVRVYWENYEYPFVFVVCFTTSWENVQEIYNWCVSFTPSPTHSIPVSHLSLRIIVIPILLHQQVCSLSRWSRSGIKKKKKGSQTRKKDKTGIERRVTFRERERARYLSPRSRNVTPPSGARKWGERAPVYTEWRDVYSFVASFTCSFLG